MMKTKRPSANNACNRAAARESWQYPRYYSPVPAIDAVSRAWNRFVIAINAYRRRHTS
jgi:hypothetical protein